MRVSEEIGQYRETYWYKHLKLLLVDLNKERVTSKLTFFGRFLIYNRILDGLIIQLKIMQLVKNHPEILREPIEKPIIVAGQQRTMTTHAQSILCARSDTQCILFYNGENPIEPSDVKASDIDTEKDPRVSKLASAAWFSNYLRPLFGLMFKIGAYAPYEDVGPMVFTFGSPEFYAMAYIPEYLSFWHDVKESKVTTFRWLKLVQQTIQWQKVQRLGAQERKKRWVMKTPEHAGFLKDLNVVYPDMRVILTHRNPVEAMESYIPLVSYINGFWNDKLNATEFGKYVAEMSQRLMNRLVDQVDLIEQDRVLNVAFKNFVKDNFGVAKQMCAFAQLEDGVENLKRMKDFIEKSPREGGNRLVYRVDTLDSGDGYFKKDNLQRMFARYAEKFKQYN